ncbi:hypothetical protein BDZ85DRAFT_3966 [Elsinoe ampelina]|uniref:Uncharacterized protein n=1 Tax=Elsinoe ampelina TaxID=302913 RepID=A0A6A6GPI2_9PEZI|nr:hypothetical protein BDZ85DRAFT_3966 [Elsinoe ampelina]
MSAPLRLDHTSIFVPESKLDDVVKFLLASLGHMGFKEFMRPYPRLVGLGHQTAFFWIGALPPEDVDEKTVEAIAKANHIAFSATDDAQVDEWYKAAMEAGGIDNGKPGIREVYHKNYYAAFVRDPFLGIGWEVVNHASGL